MHDTETATIIQKAAVTPSKRDGIGAWAPLIAVALLVAALLWSFKKAVIDLWHIWEQNPDYSVGQLVPLTAIYLAWRERKALADGYRGPSWWGLGLVLAAIALQFYGLLFLYESLERFALVLCVCGIVLVIGGWPVFWHLRWILAFLFLALPLPARIHNLISGPLQQQATNGAVFLLELFGVRADQQGFVIVLNESVPLAVAEACSGLRMLSAFVVVAGALAILVERPRWQRACLVISSIPIAIVCNLVRLLATAILYLHVNSATATTFFHDFAGVSMMPLAVIMLVGELWLLNQLAPAAHNRNTTKSRTIPTHSY